MTTSRRARSTRRGARRANGVAAVGTLPERTAVGHGARGLQRERRRLGLLQHDQARSRAYRWGEDGLAGISDDQQRLCFALALWNGKDPILKERLFGLTNSEGNHGEDVKEYYFYLDSTPTHSYMKYLYKYPQAAYPYDRPRRHQPHARPRRVRVRAARHGRVRRRPLLRRVRRVREGVAGRHPGPDHGRPIAARAGRRCTCCRRSGSATRGRGAASRMPTSLRCRLAEDGRTIAGVASELGDAVLYCRRRSRRCCSPRTRRTPSGSSAARIARPT